MNRVQAILLRVGLAACGALCMAPGCNGDVLSDSTFRLWCGDTLCDWQLDAGHVKQAATWHPDDYGVELVDTPTQISQKTTEGSSCMEFSAIADVEASAQMPLQHTPLSHSDGEAHCSPIGTLRSVGAAPVHVVTRWSRISASTARPIPSLRTMKRKVSP